MDKQTDSLFYRTLSPFGSFCSKIMEIARKSLDGANLPFYHGVLKKKEHGWVLSLDRINRGMLQRGG